MIDTPPLHPNVICSGCGADCSDHHVTCDVTYMTEVWCPGCFPETACGKGEHGEGCATHVHEMED